MPGAVNASPRDDISTVDLRDRLLSDLRRLPSRQRAVLVLRYFDGLDVAQTADVLGVSLSTVKSSASRGLAQLRLHVYDSDGTQATARTKGDTR
jgi:RNA polymerase sigma factor (sigma-70 family)